MRGRRMFEAGEEQDKDDYRDEELREWERTCSTGEGANREEYSEYAAEMGGRRMSGNRDEQYQDEYKDEEMGEWERSCKQGEGAENEEKLELNQEEISTKEEMEPKGEVWKLRVEELGDRNVIRTCTGKIMKHGLCTLRCASDGSCCQYADDSTVNKQGRSDDELQPQLEANLRRIADSIKSNRFSLNEDKTKLIKIATR